MLSELVLSSLPSWVLPTKMSQAKGQGRFNNHVGCFQNYGAPFGYRFYYGIHYLGVPKWDPNFGNYPFPALFCRRTAVRSLGAHRDFDLRLCGTYLRNRQLAGSRSIGLRCTDILISSRRKLKK